MILTEFIELARLDINNTNSNVVFSVGVEYAKVLKNVLGFLNKQLAVT